jgi:phosphoribosylformylglycinamidine cyclo-ligase
MPRKATTYSEAGVDIEAGNRAVELFRRRLSATHRPGALSEVGGFGSVFSLQEAGYKNPLLVSSTDGVGTKVMVAHLAGIHNTVGIDLVAMSANDVSAMGAEPLFFLDYVVTGKLIPELIDQIVEGVVEGCRQAGCALAGGETAEHPGHMAPDSYDLAGFCVGAVERGKLVTGASILSGDVVIGLQSSGLHSNGYSLARRVLLEDAGLGLEEEPRELEGTLGEELLRPTIIYAKAVAALQSRSLVKGLAHITGGGLPGNVDRILPAGLAAVIDSSTWTVPPIFELIAGNGDVDPAEMFSTFNMGIGMVAVVAPSALPDALAALSEAGFEALQIGEVAEASDAGPVVIK